MWSWTLDPAVCKLDTTIQLKYDSLQSWNKKQPLLVANNNTLAPRRPPQHINQHKLRNVWHTHTGVSVFNIMPSNATKSVNHTGPLQAWPVEGENVRLTIIPTVGWWLSALNKAQSTEVSVTVKSFPSLIPWLARYQTTSRCYSNVAPRQTHHWERGSSDPLGVRSSYPNMRWQDSGF